MLCSQGRIGNIEYLPHSRSEDRMAPGISKSVFEGLNCISEETFSTSMVPTMSFFHLLGFPCRGTFQGDSFFISSAGSTQSQASIATWFSFITFYLVATLSARTSVGKGNCRNEANQFYPARFASDTTRFRLQPAGPLSRTLRHHVQFCKYSDKVGVQEEISPNLSKLACNYSTRSEDCNVFLSKDSSFKWYRFYEIATC